MNRKTNNKVLIRSVRLYIVIITMQNVISPEVPCHTCLTHKNLLVNQHKYGFVTNNITSHNAIQDKSYGIKGECKYQQKVTLLDHCAATVK